jgi:peptidoglycan/xylan/chitin deacetylase (PgdA/CDA1 family)
MTIYHKIRSKLLRESKCLLRDIRYYLGLDHSFYKNARGSRILIYHGICKHDHTRFNPIFLTAKTFEKQLKLFKKHCNIITLDDYYNKRFSDDKFNICITFDDGYANNYQYVLPSLEKHNVPATFFVTGITNEGYDILWNDFLGIVSKYGPEKIIYKTELYYKGAHNQYFSAENHIALKDKLRKGGFVEKADMMKILYPVVPFKNDEWNTDYWLQMTKGQIKELAASPYAQIGAHGYYHNDLALINIEDAFNEMVQVKQYLETIIEKPVISIAFPYGSYNQGIINKAKSAGYTQLLAMDFSNDADVADQTMRERFTVNPFISPVNQLYATITRKYD